MRNEWLENFLEWKEKETINIYSVLIDNYFNSDASLKEFSNNITKLSELEADKDGAASEIFNII